MSTAPSCDLVVVLARRATLVGLLDVMRDWSAASLVAPVHFVDVDALRPGDALVPGLVLEAGRVRSVALQEALATRARTDRVRVCALTELLDTERTVTPEAALRLVEVVTGALPSVEPSRLHVIGATAQDSATPSTDVAWLGWHNVVVAPENSQSPAAGVAPVVDMPGDPLRQIHFGAAICSVVGAWLAEPRGPFDNRPVPPARSLVAARTFTRHLSASAVGSELLQRLASVDQGYPVPLVDGASAWVIDDEVGAVKEMGDALLRLHPDARARQRRWPQREPQRKIGALEAVRMLLGFLWAALRNAPGAFLDAMVRKVSVAAASAVNAAAFGRDSSFAVVVNGYKADGTPASWAEIEDALDAASARLTGSTEARPQVAADLSTMWHDMVSGGLTLLDAANRVPDLPPRMLGGRRGVVTTPTRVSPDPSESFRPPESVGAWIADRQVPSYDPVSALTLEQQLDELAVAQPHVAGQARNALSELRGWFQERRRSYTGRIGWILAEDTMKVRREIGELMQRLRSAEQAVEVPSRIGEQQRTLARRLWLVLGLALGAVVVLAVLLTLEVLTLVLFLVGLGVVAVGWLVSSTLLFLRGQQELFKMLHEREQLAAELETLRRHLTEAVEDLRRLNRAYRQYLDWCKGFGSFVQRPLGQPARLTDDEILPGAGFPLNHRFGAARPEQTVLDEAAARMSRDLFGVGWLSDAWASYLKDVPAAMGSQAFRVQESTELLFADPGVGRQSLLTLWADAVVGREDWEGATTVLRATLADLLGGSAQDLASRLLADVESRTHEGNLQSLSYEAFVNGLDTVGEDSVGYQAFARALFSNQTTGGDVWKVAETLVCQSTSGLGRTIVVTQLSHGFQSYELAVNTTAVVAATPDPFGRAPDGLIL